MQEKPTLVIMAAGMGSRYGGLKQIDPMGPNGETLMEYSVFDAIRAGFGKVVFVIRKSFAETFKQQVGRKFEKQIDVKYAFQELDALPEGFNVPAEREKPWGTGQAILCCKDFVNEPFTVQNADDYYGVEAYRVIADELAAMPVQTADSCMVGFETRNTVSKNGTVSRGICEVENGYLKSIVERLKIGTDENGEIHYYENDHMMPMTGKEICSMNFWGFTPLFFDHLEKDFAIFLEQHGKELKSEWLIPPIIDEMIKSGKTRVKVLSSSDNWFGVTYPEDKPAVVEALEKMHEQGIYPARLWSLTICD